MTDTEEPPAYEEATEELLYPAPDEQAPDEHLAFPDNGAEFDQAQEYVDPPDEVWESQRPSAESYDGLHDWTEDELNLL